MVQTGNKYPLANELPHSDWPVSSLPGKEDSQNRQLRVIKIVMILTAELFLLEVLDKLFLHLSIQLEFQKKY